MSLCNLWSHCNLHFAVLIYFMKIRNNMKSNIDKEQEDNFMKRFKYYKSNKPKPSLEQVLSTEKGNIGEVKIITNNVTYDDARATALGLNNITHWKVYNFEKHPGLILIRNPFTSLGQRYWIERCLRVYPRKPNKTNIDIEREIQDWWAECDVNEEVNLKLRRKLRWTTLGYHHNWDTKVYSEDNKNDFPNDLAELCDVFAQFLGYQKFKAEAAIVNYYHMGSTLSAHTDHSEVNLEAPLFSFSFGQSAVFLLGGHEKSIEPTAILLNSGDVIIMSKEARLCYHAVPKILPATSHPWNENNLGKITNIGNIFKFIGNDILTDINKNTDNKTWSRFNSYIQESRININVRQVLNHNQKCLADLNI